jgi:hypothetical protein
MSRRRRVALPWRQARLLMPPPGRGLARGDTLASPETRQRVRDCDPHLHWFRWFNEAYRKPRLAAQPENRPRRSHGAPVCVCVCVPHCSPRLKCHCSESIDPPGSSTWKGLTSRTHPEKPLGEQGAVRGFCRRLACLRACPRGHAGAGRAVAHGLAQRSSGSSASSSWLRSSEIREPGSLRANQVLHSRRPLRARSIWRLDSRSITSRRLSRCSLPRATASSTFTRESLK